MKSISARIHPYTDRLATIEKELDTICLELQDIPDAIPGMMGYSLFQALLGAHGSILDAAKIAAKIERMDQDGEVHR